MSTDRTPVNTRGGQAAAAAAADGAPVAPVFANPPPFGPMMMSPDQFKVFMDTCSPAAAQVRHDDGGPDFPNVSNVSVKLPTFWTHDPELWFLQTESVFNSRTPKVTRDATKFDHTVTALPADALNAIQNIIRMPVATPDRYERLKRAHLNLWQDARSTPCGTNPVPVSYTHLTLPTTPYV